jgi:hypothetical protein
MNTQRTPTSRTWLPILVLVLLAGLAPDLRAEDRNGKQGCSVRTLEGTYGFYRTGKGAFGGPLAGQGIVSFDGYGSWTALVSNSRDGEISLDEEFSGTYAIAPDCTGALLIDDLETERIVVVDEGKSYYALNVAGGATIYLVATRIHNGRGH